MQGTNIDWSGVTKLFEKEMLDKLNDLPSHSDVPQNLLQLRNIISHELPETSPIELYKKLIDILLENKSADIDKVREEYLKPELEKEKQILSGKSKEFGKLRQSAGDWVKKNLPEEKLQKMWKGHKTWLPRRYTIYENHDVPFQEIAADTLARYYLICYGFTVT